MKKVYNYIIMSVLLATMAFVNTACSDDDNEQQKYPVPTITDFFPTEGLPTSIVTIKGAEFGAERTERIGRVYFGGAEATEYVSWSDTEIQVRVPATGVSGNITLWVWKNHAETTGEFAFVPGAQITSLEPSVAFPGGTIVINGKNFQYFIDKGLATEDIVVEFLAENGTTFGTVKEFTANSLTIEVPLDAKGGAVSVSFGDYQKVIGPELTLVGDMKFGLMDYLEKSGTITVEEGGIGSTRNGAYVIYQFDAPATGLFDVFLMTGTTKDESSLNVNIGDNLNALKTGALNEVLTHEMKNTGTWATNTKDEWGAFYLEEDKTYYLKITFLQLGTTWVGNVGEIGLTLSSDQNQIPVNRPGGAGTDYVIYQQTFNSGSSYYPFRDYWAWDPSYIKVENQYLEFYFNQAALDADDRRERRGCEVVCDFKTTSEGWYGFKIFLPEGKFPKDIDGSIIAQIFNAGDRNSWAGHLSIDREQLVLSHRHALIEPIVGTVGTLEWDKWIPVVIYFKAGRNGKGNLKAWMGNNMSESSPAYNSGNVNFGFGDWIDDNTLDDVDRDGYKGSSLGGKWGLYVSSGGDRTIRFDNLKVLEGNPTGAFEIVNPGN